MGGVGSGKTTMLGDLPGVTVDIDIENGYEVLKPSDTFYVWPVKRDLSNLSQIINANFAGVDNIALDNLSELYDCMLNQAAKVAGDKNEGIPSQREYLMIQIKIREMLRTLFLWKKKGVNIVVNCWTQHLPIVQDDNLLRSMLIPSIGKKIPEAVCGMFSMVGHLEVGKTGNRRVRFMNDGSSPTKDRIYKRQYAPASGRALLDGTAWQEPKKEK